MIAQTSLSCLILFKDKKVVQGPETRHIFLDKYRKSFGEGFRYFVFYFIRIYLHEARVYQDLMNKE